MTENDMLQTIEDVKAYLNVTWDDPIRENLYRIYINSSAKRLERIYGYALDFVDNSDDPQNTSYPEDNALAKELLLSRVFYENEKALDDWEGNYQSMLNTLRWHGAVRKNKENADAE